MQRTNKTEWGGLMKAKRIVGTACGDRHCDRFLRNGVKSPSRPSNSDVARVQREFDHAPHTMTVTTIVKSLSYLAQSYAYSLSSKILR